MPKPKKPGIIESVLANPALPIERRLELLATLAANPGQENKAILAAILELLTASQGPELYAQKLAELNELIKQLQDGPLRNALFIQICQIPGSSVRQAHVVLDDGTGAYTAVPDAKLADSLRPGDCVILDGKGRALLARAGDSRKVGDVAQLERWVNEAHIEITGRTQERCVVVAGQALRDKFQAGQAPPGSNVLVSPRQSVALDLMPSQDGLAHYRYLEKKPVPEVSVEEDIGAPPKCIEELSEMIRLELTNPELRRRYRLPRCATRLLAGVSGSGKTLAVHAIWRRMYETMSEVTGTPLDKLPPRVFSLRMSQVLVMWLGESDRNLDRYFSEVEQLADEPFVAPDGKSYKLPCLAILEEVDGLAAARGREPIYDRILTTALQRLDPARQELRDRFIIYIATTNKPDVVDPAFARRIGSSVEFFSRLNRKQAFVAVLQKQLRGLPLASQNGYAQPELLRKLSADLAAWLFSPNGTDKGLVELTYAGSTTPQVRYRRDFLTGALVNRAVQQAAEKASRAEDGAVGPPGLSFELLVRSFDDQLRGIVEQLNEQNAREYTDVPDGVRVATLRRIAQPTHLAVEFQRT